MVWPRKIFSPLGSVPFYLTLAKVFLKMILFAHCLSLVPQGFIFLVLTSTTKQSERSSVVNMAAAML